MIFLLVPFFLIELYLSLKTGEEIGFLWSVIWIILSFMLGMMLFKKSSQTMLGNMQSMRQGKLDIKRFQNVSMAYFIAAIFLMIPGVFSDFLGLVALIYTLYLQFIVKITPEQTTHFTKQGDDNVIDVEIIDEHSRSDRSS
ncbi:MAG: FxsA family protein [Epsilonproteobacteria bacterium]|nr:MAG: FxsA family protein [Campylobacterota bacterium]